MPFSDMRNISAIKSNVVWPCVSVKGDALIPAAQYLRMSTENQQYSFVNQRDAVSRYADQHGFTIVRSYEDAAKSGLALRDRNSLIKLLQDAVSGEADFRAILVYDVSRWGRFQDTDEAAHYEFLCRSAGVPIYYCAEQFPEEGTVSNAIMKTVKRIMAGEYSRELSVKVFEAQTQLALGGFRLGGITGYGLRRLPLSRDGTPRKALSRGEVKPFVGDRLKLIPGPECEVAVVRRIYDKFLKGRGKIGFEEIARELNAGGIPFSRGKLWTRFTVREVLRNPKYAGVLEWSKRTQKLHTNVRPTPSSSWIIDNRAYEPIIDQHTFDRTQKLFKKRLEPKFSEREILRDLKELLLKYGYLSDGLIRAKGRFGIATYYRRLGRMHKIYDLLRVNDSAGDLAPRPSVPRVVNTRNLIISRILRRFPNELTLLPATAALRRPHVLLDGKTPLIVWAAVHVCIKGGRDEWRLKPSNVERDAPVFLCLMNQRNNDYKSAYVLKFCDLPQTECRIRQETEFLKNGRRLSHISQLCSITREVLAAS